MTDTRATMLKKILIALFLLWLTVAFGKLSIIYFKEYQEHRRAEEQLNKDRLEQEKLSKMSVPEIIDYVAPTSKHKEIAKKIVACESSNNPKAIHYNDGGKGKHSVGAWQFQKATFDGWSKKMGQDLDYYSPLDQSKVGMYMLEHGQVGQWSCSRMI